MHWFDEARFGMFVHWTHCSTRGYELSWPMVGGVPPLPHATEVTVEDYYRDALRFCPEPGAIAGWMKVAADAGVRYAILTTKHHDGFALWPSAHSDFTIAQTPYGGDLVAEFCDAARAEGVRVGFYHSLSDWHHPDYPAFTEQDKPYLAYLGRRSDTWDRYLETLFGQVTELVTNYGEIAVMWFDGQWERTAREWRTDDLAALIRSHQPDVLLNDRLPGQGDYTTPEQSLPAEIPEGRWEVCQTMNGSWGYVPQDTSYKSSTELIHLLCETAGKGGNLLLNVSPMGDGHLPSEQTERLQAIGSWLDRRGEAIYGTDPGIEPWRFYGPTTQRGDRLYLHCVMKPYEHVVVRGMPIKRVTAVSDVATGAELSWRTRATAEQTLLSSDPVGELVVDVPELDEHATVIAVDVS